MSVDFSLLCPLTGSTEKLVMELIFLLNTSLGSFEETVTSLQILENNINNWPTHFQAIKTMASNCSNDVNALACVTLINRLTYKLRTIGNSRGNFIQHPQTFISIPPVFHQFLLNKRH